MTLFIAFPSDIAAIQLVISHTMSPSQLRNSIADGDIKLDPPGIRSYPYNLGAYTCKIDTTSENCQTWFGRGLTWCYGFHQEEAERCLR